MEDLIKIGQYGIGFNVVYYFMDCLSFICNGDMICIFDFYCCYVFGVIKEIFGCFIGLIM